MTLDHHPTKNQRRYRPEEFLQKEKHELELCDPSDQWVKRIVNHHDSAL